MDAIYPYIKNEQVYNCPSMSFPVTPLAAGSPTIYPYKNSDGYNFGSYSISSSYSADGSPTPPISKANFNVWLPLSQLPVPASTAWLMDGNYRLEQYGWGVNLGDLNTSPAPPISGSPQEFNRAIARHLDTINVLWCDGHVKAMKMASLFKTNASGIVSSLTIEED